MEHHFNVEIAEKYGMLEAVLLNNLYFWISKNRANDKNYHDGHYWTYNSTKALHKLFPYASERRIRNAMKHLEDDGLLLTGNYNQSAYDRTMWYALTETAISILQNRQMEESKMSNENSKNVTPIPYNKTDNKTDIYRDVPDGLRQAFMEWAAMRAKIKKPIITKNTVTRALNALKKLSEDEACQIAIINQSTDHCWQSFYALKEEDENAERIGPKSRAYKEFEPEPEIDAVEMPEEIRSRLSGIF